jgi:hypothetical protein
MHKTCNRCTLMAHNDMTLFEIILESLVTFVSRRVIKHNLSILVGWRLNDHCFVWVCGTCMLIKRALHIHIARSNHFISTIPCHLVLLCTIPFDPFHQLQSDLTSNIK